MGSSDIEIPVFIDFGGTLVSTIEVTKKAFREAIGKEFTDREIIQMFKDAAKKRGSMYLFFKYPVNPIKLILNRKKILKLQKEYFRTEVKLVPKIKEVLLKLKKIKELKLILVTQNPLMENKEFADELITKLLGEKIFDMVLAGEDKLDLISEKFDSDFISRGILIGDLPTDVEVADILKIICIGVTWGYSDRNELKTPFIAETPEDLYQLVLDHIEDVKEDMEIGPSEKEIEFEEEL